jgi:cobyrinic acid a,c-diamide synthase
MIQQPRGLLIAGAQSGVGKTTLTLGLIAAFTRRGLKIQPFKTGPDFIDPGHHTRAAGLASRNLDGWMLSRESNLAVFQRQARGADLALVEGAMGLFDGYDGLSEAGSGAQLAKWLGLPVLLVVDARAMARSAAALVKGFAEFDPGLKLAGVVFNRIGSPAHLTYLRQAVAPLDLKCYGGLPRDQELAIPERHLGLATAEDHPLGMEYLGYLAGLLENHLDLDGLWTDLPVLPLPPVGGEPDQEPAVRLGVARDNAFCFYYPDNLELLAHYGAALVPFSPVADQDLPPDLHGLYLGGGYPELYASRLAANQGLRRAIKEKAKDGMPIYAECGGLMYLSQEIEDLAGQRYPMAGVFPFRVRMLAKRRALGYREITLTAPGLLGPGGTRVRGHEFHYSEIVEDPRDLPHLYRLSGRAGVEKTEEGYCLGNVLASYVHLHFGSNPDAARHLVSRCLEYQQTL